MGRVDDGQVQELRRWAQGLSTDPRPEVQAAAKNEGSRSVDLDGGGLAVYDTKAPTNVHLAFPDEAYQVEVFSPTGDLALRLVANGKIQPVPAPAP